jgi:hypothetical protein
MTTPTVRLLSYACTAMLHAARALPKHWVRTNGAKPYWRLTDDAMWTYATVDTEAQGEELSRILQGVLDLWRMRLDFAEVQDGR